MDIGPLTPEERQLLLKLRKMGTMEIPDEAPWDPRIPESLADQEDSAIYPLQGSKLLVMSDLHIPWHSPLAISEALREARRHKVDAILLNGDIIDNYSLSEHARERGNKLRNWKYELDATIQFLTWLREDFPHAQLYYKFGNHESRFDRRMMSRLPEMDAIDQFTLQELFKLTSMGVVYIEEWRLMSYGFLNVAHGHELRASSQIPGRNVRMKAHENILVGHVHRTSEDSAKRIDGKTFAGWSTGCMCGLYPRWLPVNQWNWGYAIVERAHDGTFHVDNKRVLP